MKDGAKENEELIRETLRLVSPGTALYEGLENILRARTGALIVVGDSEEVLSLVNGGFRIDTEVNPAALYELAKMDGALILSRDAKRILYANAHLTPDPMIPTVETGSRHRTAEQVARQTGALVISISQRRNIITLYRGTMRYVLQDVGVLLTKANQALSTLERYKSVLEQSLSNLSALEFEDLATLTDVATCLQRAQLVSRIAREIERYVAELGVEGRLVSMQLDELMVGIENEGLLIIMDYRDPEHSGSPQEILQQLESCTSDELLELGFIARALGHGGSLNSLEVPVTPRGYRVLHKIPRLPAPVIENIVQTFKSLPEIMEASIDELDDVEGIGEVRAKAIKDGLRRLREQALLDRHL
ncbi:MAG: DNA integrity scanning diadenylate cyclase DisA [Clostridia bacterium]|nr:DNA integrity scanning protein DisA [Bacillota bacterium]MBO2522017.1 DNA integrity scanning protein DisA [Bacillota bacterium]